MPSQQSSGAGLLPALSTYYSKKSLQDFEPKTVWYMAAPETTEIPQNEGQSVSWVRYKKLPPQRSDNASEFSATQFILSAETVTARLHNRDSYVQLSRYAELTVRNKPLDQAVEKVTEQAAKSLDIMIRNDIGLMIADVANASSLNYQNMAIDGGTLHSSGRTARIWSHDQSTNGDRFPVYHNKGRLAQSALVTSIAKSGMTIKTIMAAVNVLESKDVPPLSDGYYTLITRPEVVYQITSSMAFKGWLQYTSSDSLRKSPKEVGVIAGTRIMQSTLGYKFPVSGDTLSTASGAIYASLLFGQEAYGVASVAGANGGRKGFILYIKQSGEQTTSDPTNQKKQVGYSITGVGKILNKSAGMWILSTEKY